MNELRQACAEVARRARQVTVHEDVIVHYAASLELGNAPAHAAADDDTPGATRAERAAFWLTLDAINFGSGWFPTLRKSGAPTRSGYGTISSAWRARFESEGPFTAAQLTALTSDDVAAILGQDPDHELMQLFALSLADLGGRLLAGYGGEFTGVVAAAGGSAVALAYELGGWPCFADRSRYQELSVPFLKRAQIAAADLRRSEVADWYDEAELTMFADNLVPHVLRLDGVLTFDDELVARIDRGELIDHGSAEEVEIRACAVHAVELIVAAANAARAGGGAVTAADVDQLLWHRGQGPFYKASPRHRSRCTAY